MYVYGMTKELQPQSVQTKMVSPFLEFAIQEIEF